MEKILTIGNDQYVMKHFYDMSSVTAEEIERIKINRYCDSLIIDKNQNRYILADKIKDAEYSEILEPMS